MAIGASRIYRGLALADYTCMVELVDFKPPEAESDASIRRLLRACLPCTMRLHGPK